MLRRRASARVARARVKLPLKTGAHVANDPQGNFPAVMAWPDVHGTGGKPLWLCIVLPSLPLEALASPVNTPVVVVSEQRKGLTVCACNERAQRAGITPGMNLNAARALCPGLQAGQRDEAAEAALLNDLAGWALGCTPLVSVDATGALLLEIGGSLKVFAGLQALRERLLGDLRARGHEAVAACAPTARAALWLARAGLELGCTEARELQALLAEVPLEELGWPPAILRKLCQMGLTRLGDCVRLPRAGFARRIGAEYLRELDQAFGRQPELLERHGIAEHFEAELEFDFETLCAEQIAAAADMLLQRLGEFLRRRQAGVQRVSLRLEHCAHPATITELELREPCDQLHYLRELLRLRLDRLTLPAHVTGVALACEALAASAQTSLALPGMAAGEESSGAALAARLVERLRARLGPASVYGLGMVAEHRPEFAWRTAEAAGAYALTDTPGRLCSRPRPLWLLDAPERIEVGVTAPADARAEIERIETGWWDGADVRRDYCALEGPQGCRWWVYRDCEDSAWYLHGLFG